jgi:putative intracellular protease/amidase
VGYAQAELANTRMLSSISARDHDAAFYPGGHGPLWDLANDPHSIALIETMFCTGRPLALVCHGPGALRYTMASNGRPLVAGKSVTGFSNLEEAAIELTDADQGPSPKGGNVAARSASVVPRGWPGCGAGRSDRSSRSSST